MKTHKLMTTAALISTFALMGCDKANDLIGDLIGDMTERRSSSNSGDDNGNDERKQGFIVDEEGTARLLPPDDLQQRKGVPISTTELATGGASGTIPGKSWVYGKPKDNGAFLISSASKPGTIGGDMIRRIDLGSIKEHDYDPDQKGPQGAYIYVPDSMREAVPAKYVDSEGLFRGTICAMVPGPNKTVIALGSGTEGGVGFVINPYEDATAFTPLQAIKFPYSSNSCRGVYSEDLKKLFVIDVTRTDSKGGQEGVFVADIYNDNRGSTASLYTFDTKYRINSHTLNNFMGIELYKDALYLLSGNGRFDSEWDTVIYRVPLNTAGEPLFENLKYTRTYNPIVRTYGCNISSWNIGAIAVVEHDDKPVLLTTGTTSLIAWDISDGDFKKLDLNSKKPGVQALNLEDNGQGGLKLSYDPAGKTIFQLPHCRSNQNKVKIGNGDDMLAFNISSLSIDGLKAQDPIDIGYRELLTSLKTAAYRPIINMTLRDFAVGPKHIGVLGLSASNQSGLGAGGDVIIVDRNKKTNIAFNKASDMRRAHELKYGFKLAKGDPKFDGVELNSHAMMWIP